MSTFWMDRLSAAEPQPEYAPGSGAAYRAERRAVNASAIYADPGPTPEQRAAHRPSLYDGSAQYEGLSGYQQEQQSLYAWDPSTQTPEAYIRDLKRKGLVASDGTVGANAELLDPADWEAVEASVKAIQDAGKQTFEGTRTVLDQHAQGLSGVQQTGTRGLGRGFSDRSVDGQGNLAAGASIVGLSGNYHSSAEAYAAARHRAEEQRGNPTRPVIPSTSSGTGWVGVDR